MSNRRYADAAKEGAEQVKNGRVPPPPEPWGAPVPFDRAEEPPAFPVPLLPGWLAEWVSAEAEATQTPPDLAANLALAVAGAAVARKVRVCVRDGWSEPANVFNVVSLPPGERKSAVFADATSPLLEHERAEQQEAAPVIAARASEHRVMEAKLKGIEAKAAKSDVLADADKLRQEARELAKQLAGHVVPDLPEFFCDDVTVQKLGQLLARQGGRMLLASAEGTAFDVAKGRYSETADFDVFLKGHAGDPLRVGRIGREKESLNDPALSCALAVQPNVISGLSEQASMRGRGFLARWLYSLPASKVGKRKVAADPVPAAAARCYRQCMLWLWQWPPSTIPGQEAGRILRFAADAGEALRDLENWLEPQLAEGEPLSYLAGWASKLAGAIARLSLIMHMADTLGTGAPWDAPIRRETVEAAVVLGRDYYLPHARAAFGLMGADQRAGDAARVVAWLTTRRKSESLKVWKGVQVVSKSDIHTGVFGGSRTVEEVGAVCRMLMEHGYIRPVGASWRRDSQLFEVNPDMGHGDEP
jgi:hypothetical protein